MKNYIIGFLLVLFSGYSTEAQTLSVSFIVTDATCSSPSGKIYTNGYGGVAPYTFLWSTGATVSDLLNLNAGTYTVTVTDQTGATASQAITVNDLPSLHYFSISWSDPVSNQYLKPCSYLCNGVAFLIDSTNFSGIPPYTASQVNNPNVTFGTYNGYPAISNICNNDSSLQVITITDAVGCTGSTPLIAMGYPYTFNCNVTVTGSCTGDSAGSFFVDMLSGNGFHMYVISAGDTVHLPVDYLVTDLPAGNYTVIVKPMDNTLNCDTSFTVVIPQITNCGLITGTVFLDTVVNCTADPGEPGMPNRLVRFTPTGRVVSTDQAGYYSARLPYNTYNIDVVPAPYIITGCNVTGVVLSAMNDTVTADIGIQTVTANDVGISIFPGRGRPGGITFTSVSVTNYSYYNSGPATIDIYFDPILTLAGSAPFTVTVISAGHVQWNIADIPGWSFTGIILNLQVPPLPSLTGTFIPVNAEVLLQQTDVNLTNNTAADSIPITNSLDPNDKSVSPARDALNTYYLDVDTTLRFTVNFQNTGTDTAFVVSVRDTLSEYLDLSTFQMLGASHPFVWNINDDNVLEVTFNNIMLADSNVNEPLSHGVFSYAVKPLPAAELPILPVVINNKVDIYFDFNPPVTTNTTFSTVTLSTGLSEVNTHGQFQLWPNPAGNDITIKTGNSYSGTVTLTIEGAAGRTVYNNVFKGGTQTFNIAVDKMPAGMYFVTLTTADGNSYTEKLIIIK